MGYGIIHIKESQIILLEMGVLHLSKLTSHELKLKKYLKELLNY